MHKSHQAWEYLKSRGIGHHMVVEAMLGFSTGEGLYEALTAEGYLHSVLFAKSLVKTSKIKDLNYVDFFGKGRIIFPCLLEGRVVGMQSRICYETDNKAIPRYKMLGGSSWQFYCPDFVKKGKPIVVVEGPMDVLTLKMKGIDAVCFLGTSGFKQAYKERLSEATTIYCMPDAEDNVQSRNANMRMYVDIQQATGKMPLVLDIPKGPTGKQDPADYFSKMTDREARQELGRLIQLGKYLDQTKEWNDHLRKLRDDQRKKEQREQTMKEGEKLEKFPIIQTLEKLGVDIVEGYSARPTCMCFNPEHEDTQPSVHIYESTQTFHCFGCNAGHDAIDAVRMVKGLSFNQAIDWLKENLYEDTCP